MTKTAVFVPIYLDGWDLIGNNRYWRVHRWLTYILQSELRDALDYDDIIVSDNGSTQELKNKLRAEFPEIKWITHVTSLKKLGDKLHDYPYCWRALYDYADVARTGVYAKVYKFETDSFILSSQLAFYLGHLNSGWTAMGLTRPKGFPADELSVICADSFKLLTNFCSGDFMQHHGKVFERALPFTHIETGYYCHREGAAKKPPEQSLTMDAYGQAPFYVNLLYNWGY